MRPSHDDVAGTGAGLEEWLRPRRCLREREQITNQQSL